MPVCDHIHSSLLIIALPQAAGHSSSSAGSKWPICQAGQLQLNRPGQGAHSHAQVGPEKERTCGGQPTGQARSLQQAAQEPGCPAGKGLKAPPEPHSLGPTFLSAGRGPAPCSCGKQEPPGGTPAPVFPPPGSIWSLSPPQTAPPPNLQPPAGASLHLEGT